MRKTLLKNILVAMTLFIIMSMIAPNGTTPVSADVQTQELPSLLLQASGPLGPQGQPLENVETLVMPQVDVAKLLIEDEQTQIGQPPRFAQSISTQIDPATHGTWEALDNGVQLWRLRIISSGAVSLNMGFTTYHMPEGGQLHLYAPDYSEVLGPYTDRDNAEHGQLWTPIINADEIVLEVSLPAEAISELQLELTAVNHGYKDFDKAEKSGSCNVDVVCSVGNPWRNEIRSVGRYIFSGMYLCTGALINNTAHDNKPYFLTAHHCVSTSGEAASVVVYWNYQNSTCRTIGSSANGTPISAVGFPTQSGAVLRATYAPSDMTLLELSSSVSNSINAFWSGWSRANANATSAVAIHHPQGHEKRISFEYAPTTITSYLGTAIPGGATHLRVADWDLGTTEGGSSGSPLYDQNRRIIGQLHGGYAACGNDLADWYGRFYVSWTGGGTSATRLSDWLDPSSTGAMTLNGKNASTFADVAFDYWAWSYIQSIFNAGVTGGCGSNPTIYCPTGTVTRDQMAIFLLRAKYGSVYTPPAVGGSTGFADVPTSHWAAAWIKQLAAEGITGGCGGGNYCPSNPVTRAQMAIFLLRAKYGSAYTPPAVGGSTGFTDVPITHSAAAWIKQLAAEGITGGCGGGNYCPNNAVSRDSMAVFLQRTFNLTLP